MRIYFYDFHVIRVLLTYDLIWPYYAQVMYFLGSSESMNQRLQSPIETTMIFKTLVLVTYSQLRHTLYTHTIVTSHWIDLLL